MKIKPWLLGGTSLTTLYLITTLVPLYILGTLPPVPENDLYSWFIINIIHRIAGFPGYVVLNMDTNNVTDTIFGKLSGESTFILVNSISYFLIGALIGALYQRFTNRRKNT